MFAGIISANARGLVENGVSPAAVRDGFRDWWSEAGDDFHAYHMGLEERLAWGEVSHQHLLVADHMEHLYAAQSK
jgi:hypothetical protein